MATPVMKKSKPCLIRTLAGWGFGLPITFLTALTVLVWSAVTRSGDVVHKGARFWGRAILWLCDIKVVINGLEHLSESASSMLIVANHQSMFDIFAFEGYFPVKFAWIAKKSIFRIPLVGAAMRRGGYISIDRADSESARLSLQKAAEHLRDYSIVIFPEGTRSRSGSVGKFKKGALHLAEASRVPILPVTVTGSWERLKPEHWVITPGVLTLHIDPPVLTVGKTHEEIEEDLSAIRDAMIRRVDASH
ncbi:MAG: lysophospholipid acyltransferase family protein [bacterium]